VIHEAPGQTQLLAIWEDGAGKRAGTRAIALLGGALPGLTDDDLAALPIGRRDAALLELRERLFGSRFTGVTTCPSCFEELEVAFEAAELRRELPQTECASLRVEEVEIELRLPTGADLIAIETALDVDAAREMLVSRCLVRATRDARPVSVGELPADVVDQSVLRLRELDPQADVSLDVHCPACGEAWREPFDIASYLWGELSTWARRLLGEVHQLALAYGWSERDILSLTPVRRNAYLACLQ